MIWHTKSSRTVYKNRWMRVTQEEVIRENGSQGLYSVVRKPDYAVIVPLDGDQIYLVEQFRYPVSGRYWELPQGSWEDEPDKAPVDLARAELKEETGLSADELKHAGHLFQAYGYSNQGFNIFVATGLTRGGQNLDAGEHGMICKSFSFSQIKDLIAAGQIKDATTLAVFGLMQIKGLLPPTAG